MKILIAGDFAPRARLAKQIENRKFSEVFPEDICEVIKSADFSFLNFESPVVEEGYKPILNAVRISGAHQKQLRQYAMQDLQA